MDAFLLHNQCMAGELFTFGAYTFDAGRGALMRDEVPLAVSNRGLALLRALLEASGEVVAKSALMDAAWPNASVEESNLTVQIAALRKSLGNAGEEWIATVPRIGYRFAGRFNAAANFSAGVAPVSPRSAAADLAIAVLPFTNMSSDPEQEFFADGLAEDLITDLSKAPGLIVIARYSSFAYKGKGADLRVVAKDLGVRYIVEGSVRRAAARVRISAQLIDAVEHGHIWADRFDRDLADIFALQDEIVGKIVNALAGALPTVSLVASRRASNLEAYDLFVRGRVLATKSPDDNRVAQSLLERSIEIDPDFAPAHAWLALAHSSAWAYFGEPMDQHFDRSLISGRRAVALDPGNADAHSVFGYVLMYSGGLEEGENELRRALQINPNQADALAFLGELKALQGNATGGIEDIRKAFRLNPLPQNIYYWMLGYAQYAAGHYQDAIETLRHDATHRTGSQRILAASLAQLGHLEEARREAKEFLSTVPNFTVTQWAATQPFKNDVDRQRFVEGYLKAGLPM